jgi:DMSO/TMAO reductase YedYZ molybdopterin-dependent catalytic subunit
MNTVATFPDFRVSHFKKPRASPLLRAVGFALGAALPTLVGYCGEPVLTVASVNKTITLSAEEFQAMPHSVVTATDPHLKLEHRYSGVPVRDLLAKVDAPLGDKLRGPALQLAVIFHSRDGYATLFALAEFDDAFSDRTILLADSEDGKPLAENAGPLRVVAPGDKRAARWARMVTSIELVRLPSNSQVR